MKFRRFSLSKNHDISALSIERLGPTESTKLILSVYWVSAICFMGFVVIAVYSFLLLVFELPTLSSTLVLKGGWAFIVRAWFMTRIGNSIGITGMRDCSRQDISPDFTDNGAHIAHSRVDILHELYELYTKLEHLRKSRHSSSGIGILTFPLFDLDMVLVFTRYISSSELATRSSWFGRRAADQNNVSAQCRWWYLDHGKLAPLSQR